MEQVDALIVGAGVVGLAIAAKLSESLDNVILIDKNSQIGEETSSRNSEVIHAGIYYPQDSLKATLSVEGKAKLYEFCDNWHVPYHRIGKLLVATSEQEAEKLQHITQHASNNGVNDLQWLTQHQIKSLEPNVAAHSALISPSTGIVNVHAYMHALLAKFEKNGGVFVGLTDFIAAQKTHSGFDVELNSHGQYTMLNTAKLINCGGLHSVKVANRVEGLAKQHIPELYLCRGHYFSYSGKAPFNHLIYPVPEGAGLGIHATLDLAGQVKFGPDTEYIEQIDYQVELDLKDKFYNSIQRYFPNIDKNKLQPAYAGIRPKLQGPNDGFKDFMIQWAETHQIKGLVNLYGIESPGLTSSLAIADHIFTKYV